MVKLLFLEGGEEALHPRVVIACAGTAHALDSLILDQAGSKGGAGELAAAVGVKNHGTGATVAVGVLEGLNAQFGTHIVLHGQANYLTVEAIQDRRTYCFPSRQDTSLISVSHF